MCGEKIAITSGLFHSPVELSDETVNSLVIEHGAVFRSFVSELAASVDSGDDAVAFWFGDRKTPAADCVELFTEFPSFSIDSKALLAALAKKLDRLANLPRMIERSTALLDSVRAYIGELALDFSHEISADALTTASLIKAAGLHFVDDGLDLDGKILAYMRLVRELIGDRIFVFVNLRGYFMQEEFETLTHAFIMEKFTALFIDPNEFPKVLDEKRFILDKDRCEIQ